MKLPRPRNLIILSIILLVALTYIVGSVRKTQINVDGSNITSTPPIPVSVQNTKEVNFIANSQLPMESPDVEITYSKMLKKFYIHKKTDKARDAINQFFIKNNLRVEINNIVYTDQNAYDKMVRDEFRSDPSMPHPDTTDNELH